jgi:transcriptional regulator with XRE-family HTH domain
MQSMAARAKKSKLRDARLHLGLSQAEVGGRLGVTGAAIGHYETGLSKPSPDRAAQLARLLGLKPSEVSASERESAKVTVARPRSDAAKQAASRVNGVKVPSRDEGAVLDALRAMPAAERRVMVKLVLAYGGNGSRAAAERRR